jgi:DNA polymerase-3 subunit delta'
MTTATGFNAIVGQQHPIRLLKTFIRNGKLPHALLFTGDDGVGKKLTAKAFAMACNCLNLKSARPRHADLDVIDACGDCAPCRKIAGNHHPDVIHVAPLSSVIRIAQIRTLLQTLTLKPNEADRRVVILSDAQAMNAEAGNALLKVLEEPPDRTLLVLTASQPSDLLPTVVSRCRHIRFLPLGQRISGGC